MQENPSLINDQELVPFDPVQPLEKQVHVYWGTDGNNYYHECTDECKHNDAEEQGWRRYIQRCKNSEVLKNAVLLVKHVTWLALVLDWVLDYRYARGLNKYLSKQEKYEAYSQSLDD